MNLKWSDKVRNNAAENDHTARKSTCLKLKLRERTGSKHSWILRQHQSLSSTVNQTYSMYRKTNPSGTQLQLWTLLTTQTSKYSNGNKSPAHKCNMSTNSALPMLGPRTRTRTKRRKLPHVKWGIWGNCEQGQMRQDQKRRDVFGKWSVL